VFHDEADLYIYLCVCVCVCVCVCAQCKDKSGKSHSVTRVYFSICQIILSIKIVR